MPHRRAFCDALCVGHSGCLKRLVRRFGLVDAQRDLVGDADAVAFEGHYFFGVIGEDADVLEAEVNQDLRADAAFVLDHALAGGVPIQLAALVEMNLGKSARFPGGLDAETTAGVVEIKENTTVFLGDCSPPTGDQFAAVACRRTKNIPPQTEGMNPKPQ